MIGALIVTFTIGIVINRISKNEPLKREKLFSKSLFKTFIKNGFERKDDFLLGIFQNYSTIIEYTSASKQIIRVIVLFDPYSKGQKLSNEERDQFSKKNSNENLFQGKQYIWTNNSIIYDFEYVFTTPSYDEIMCKIEDMINILAHEKLKPISYDNMQMLLSALINQEEKSNKIY